MDAAMTLEQALRLTNRNMIVFDLVLGSAAIAAPTAALKVLGHDEPSPDAQHLFRRSGPGHPAPPGGPALPPPPAAAPSASPPPAALVVAARRGKAADWQALAW